MLCQGFLILSLVLSALADPVESFQAEIPVIHKAHDISASHQISCPQRSLSDITVKRSDNNTFHRTLKDRVCRNPIITHFESEKEKHCGHQEGNQLPARISGSKQFDDLVFKSFGDLQNQGAVILALDLQCWKKKGGNASTISSFFIGERLLRRPFQCQGPIILLLPIERHGENGPRTVKLGQLFMISDDKRVPIPWRRIKNLFTLKDGFIHGRLYGADQIHMLPELSTMRHRLNSYTVLPCKTDTDPIALE